MTKSMSSYMPTDGASVTRTADVLTWPFSARPQAATFYVRFIESPNAGATAIIFQVSDAATNSPYWRVYRNTDGNYVHEHAGASSTVSITQATPPASNDLVELRAVINVNGSVTLGQSLNGGQEVVVGPSAAAIFGSAWSADTLRVNSIGTIASSVRKYLVFAVVRGIQTLDTMRRLAGTDKK